MTPQDFETSLEHATPPSGIGPVLQSLWWAKKGDWNRAHELAQSQSDREAAWVHAHLHRIEGDDANAGYWYRQAGQPYPEQSLDAEWDDLVGRMLGAF